MKRILSLGVAVWLCAGTALAAAPVFVDASGLLTAQERQVAASIVAHYATGARSLEARMDDAEDAIEDYLERRYGDDVYDVRTQFARGGEVQLIAERQAMQLDPHRTGAERIVDVTGRLTAVDLTTLETIITRAAVRGDSADAVENAIERYLDGQYGRDRYDADVERQAAGYRVLVTAD